MRAITILFLLLSIAGYGQQVIQIGDNDTIEYSGTLPGVIQVGKVYVGIGGSASPQLVTIGSDIVKNSGYFTQSTTHSLSTVDAGRSFLNMNNIAKSRSSDSIHRVTARLYKLDLVTALYLDVWRKDGSTWDRIHHVNILPLSSPTPTTLSILYTFELVTPLKILEGDYIGLSLAAPASGSQLAHNSSIGNSRYVNGYPSATDYNWSGANLLEGYIISFQTYSHAPMVIGIGNSIMAGHTAHYSFVEVSETVSLSNQILYQLHEIDNNYTYQNMGIGGNTSTQIKDRFNADCLNLKPKIAIIECGVNDIYAGSVTRSTFLANYKIMLDTCDNNNIIPVVLKIMPWTNGTNEQMQTMDSWNSGLDSLTSTYDNCVFVDLDETLGQFRVGGDVGNLWDIKTAYNVDGVHFNLAGYTAIAVKIDAEIKKKYRFQ